MVKKLFIYALAISLFSLSCEKQKERKVKYYFYSDTYNRVVAFFDDGTAYGCINCEMKIDAKGNILLDKDMEELTSEGAPYREFSNYLGIGKIERYDLFDDLGRIHSNWQIINHYRVYSSFQMTNFEPETAKIPAKDIQEIKETRLIFIIPENSHEEWAWYQDDRKKEFAEMGIQSVDAQKRYLSFKLYDGEKITIDTKKEQNGTTYSALLYRNGYIPIMISISGENEEGMEQIENYLSESGDGYPPFELWN